MAEEILTKEEMQEKIAERAAKELTDHAVVNLGIGLPTRVAGYIPKGVHVTLQSENGFLGLGPRPKEIDPTIVNAGGQPVSIYPGGAFFDSSLSFGIIRGGHVDFTILGALQVDQNGNIANYLIPGKMVPGMGGAMDLLVGARKVIVAMEHTNKGQHKLLKKCDLPLTARGVVDMIVTEMGVFEPAGDGFKVLDLSPHFTFGQVQEATEARLIWQKEA